MSAGNALFSVFEKVAANLGIDIIAAQGNLQDKAHRLFFGRTGVVVVTEKTLAELKLVEPYFK